MLGGANVDLKARSGAPVVLGTSNPGTASLAAGGVGRNIAENLARLGTPTALLTVVGEDALGEDLLVTTAAAGVDVSLVRRRGDVGTGTYTAVLDDTGELLVAVADMTAAEALGPADVEAARDAIAAAALLVVDGNLRPETVTAALDVADAAGVPVVVEPVSVPKARRLAPAVRRPLLLLTPNADELGALTGAGGPVARADIPAAAARLHADGVAMVWVRLGADGSVLSLPEGATACPSVRGEVVDVTGAGDAALAAFVHVLLAGAPPQEAARLGHAAAALTVASTATVRPDLTETLIRSLPA